MSFTPEEFKNIQQKLEAIQNNTFIDQFKSEPISVSGLKNTEPVPLIEENKPLIPVSIDGGYLSVDGGETFTDEQVLVSNDTELVVRTNWEASVPSNTVTAITASDEININYTVAGGPSFKKPKSNSRKAWMDKVINESSNQAQAVYSVLLSPVDAVAKTGKATVPMAEQIFKQSKAELKRIRKAERRAKAAGLEFKSGVSEGMQTVLDICAQLEDQLTKDHLLAD